MKKIEFLIDDVLHIIKLVLLFLLTAIILAWLLTEIDQYVDAAASDISRRKIFFLNLLFAFFAVSIVVKKVDSMTSWPRWLKFKFISDSKYDSVFYIVMNSAIMVCLLYIVKYTMITYSGLIYSDKEITILYNFIAISLLPVSLLIFVMIVVRKLKYSQ